MSKSKTLFILLLACAAMMIKMAIASCPNVLALDLQRDLMLSVVTLAAIGSAITLGSAFMQLPVGILTDKFGSRNVLVPMVLLMGLATLVFGFSQSAFVATTSRFITGLGYGFMVPLLAMMAFCFPPEFYARSTSIIMASASLGMVLVMGPLASIVESVGWRLPVLGMGIIAVLIALLLFLVVPSQKHSNILQKASNPASENLGMWKICKILFQNIQFHACWIWYCIICGVSMTLGAMWWIPWLVQGCGMEGQSAANLLSLFMLGNMLMLPITAWLSDVFFKSRKKILVSYTLIAVLCLPLMIMLNGNPSIFLHSLAGLPFYIAISSACPIILAVASESFSPSIRATILALISLASEAGIVIVQLSFGLILDYQTTFSTTSQSANFTPSLWWLEILLIVGLLAVCMLKESFPSSSGQTM